MNQQQWLAELNQIREIGNWAAGEARRAQQLASSAAQGNQKAQQLLAENAQIRQHLTDLSNTLAALRQDRLGGGSGDPDVQRIENVPGRRVPYDYLTEISIAENDTSIRTGTITISQDGPFVAQARFAAFLSEYAFQVTDDQNQTGSFLGRSNGRFRPIHSAGDIMDAFLPADVGRTVAFPGTGDPSYSSPALHAPYRTMEFDARITLVQQGSSYPRSNIPVPTPFWTTFLNSPFPLAALDFFARAEIIQFEVQPQHVNNPNAGNINGFGAGPFPFSDAQFDHHEGIADPEDPAAETGDPDPVVRLPRGTLIVGFHGYRIIQPPGAVVQPSAV